MAYEQQDVENFIRAFLDGIKKGVGDNDHISGDIEFELAVVKTTAGGGRLKIFVVDAEGKYSRKKISMVKFKVTPEQKIIPFK